MSIKVKINSNGKPTNGKVVARKKTHLPTQKDIADSLKDVEMTAEDEKLIEVSMRAMEAIKNEQERAKRLEKRQNSLRGKPRLLMQKDFDLPENFIYSCQVKLRASNFLSLILSVLICS